MWQNHTNSASRLTLLLKTTDICFEKSFESCLVLPRSYLNLFFQKPTFKEVDLETYPCCHGPFFQRLKFEEKLF